VPPLSLIISKVKSKTIIGIDTDIGNGNKNVHRPTTDTVTMTEIVTVTDRSRDPPWTVSNGYGNGHSNGHGNGERLLTIMKDHERSCKIFNENERSWTIINETVTVR
jgi:hypothetical protein